jgi:uncharacterized HAD superfamily protein
MKSLEIGFDIDGVLTDLPKRMVEVAKEKFGKVITPENIYQENELAQAGLTQTELDEMFQPEFFYDMEPYLHNILALQRLVEDGHRITFISARPRSTEMRRATLEWFEKYGVPDGGGFGLFLTHHKAEVAAWLGLERFVEDFTTNANSIAKVMKHVYLINQPYNLKDKVGSNVLRVDTVMAIRKRLKLELNQLPALNKGEGTENAIAAPASGY